MLACEAFKGDATARQDFGDAKDSLGRIATRHQFGAKDDTHSGTRPDIADGRRSTATLRCARLSFFQYQSSGCSEAAEAQGSHPKEQALGAFIHSLSGGQQKLDACSF
jgi:hypothetical protein